MTHSESIFERFCIERKLNFSRIPEGKSKAPDYYLELGDGTLVVEVKQIDANREEKLALQKPPEEWTEYEVFHWDTPGDRLRKKIATAVPQLRVLSKGRFGTLLVVFDNIKAWPELADEYAVRVAMYGIERALISPDVAPEGGAKVLRRWYGPKRSVTVSHNTTLSAVAIMAEEESGILMNVYHNWYAHFPLEKGLLTLPGVTQFELEQAPTSGFGNWKRAS